MSIPANEILKYISEVRSELDAPAQAPAPAGTAGSSANKFTGPYPTRFSPRSKTIEEIYQEIMSHADCVTLKDLAVNGKDLIEMGMKPGKELGETLQMLLELVIDIPELNTKEILLEKAASVAKPSETL